MVGILFSSLSKVDIPANIILSKVGVPANLPAHQTNTCDDIAMASLKTAVFKGKCSPACSM